MAHKAYRWIDTAGRPTTPPPDPFDIMEQRAKGGYKVLSEADERKVCPLPWALNNFFKLLQVFILADMCEKEYGDCFFLWGERLRR